MRLIITAIAGCAIGAPALAGFANVDFSTEDDFITPLVNGQEINVGEEFGNLFSLSSPDGRLAIFDTSNPGANDGGGDPDLLINQGNALIIQNGGLLTQSTADIFDTPNDSANGGAIVFDFVVPSEPGAIDLIDVDDNNGITVTLTDDMGRQRVYDVPNSFTNEAPDVMGFDTLNLTTLSDQMGEGGGIATVTTSDAGYDALRVVQLEVDFSGSGGLDNFVINSVTPSPGAMSLMALAGVVGVRRRRA